MSVLRPISDRFLNSQFNNTLRLDNSSTTNNILDTDRSLKSTKKIEQNLFENFSNVIPRFKGRNY